MKSKWFNTDGQFWSLLDICGQLIILSFLWMVGSLPLITLGTSTTALYYAVTKSIRRGIGTPWKEFLRSYRANLLRGIGVTLTAGLLLTLLIFNLEVLKQSADNVLLWAGNAVTLGVVSFSCVYICPILSRFSLPLWESWKLAFVMAFRFLPYTLLLLAGFAAVCLLQFFVIPVPGILALPGLWCLITTFPCEKGLRRFMPKKEKRDTAWYYE